MNWTNSTYSLTSLKIINLFDYEDVQQDDAIQNIVTRLFHDINNQMPSRVLDPESDIEITDINGERHDEFCTEPVEISNVFSRPTLIVDRFRETLRNLRQRTGNPNEVYYYHSDHLGSASWITDNTGIPIQHLQYLPFGEPFVSQRISGYNERFTFTGKERDEETGYNYHGARYYDADLLTCWQSVDPLADKYPSMSPYNYCTWNPIKLVDPDGDEAIEICPWYRSKTGNMIYSTKNVSKIVRDGETYNYDGMTAVHGNKYYSLLGDCLDANSEQGKFTQDVDNVLINHALWRKRAKNITCNETKTKMNSIPNSIKKVSGLPTTSENIVDPLWTYSGAKVRIYQNDDKSGYVKEMISDILKRKHFDTSSNLGVEIEGYGLRIGNSALIYFDDFEQAHDFYSIFFKLFPESK